MSTPNLDISTIPENSLQPGVAVNDGFQVVDALLQLRVQDKDLTTPPTTTDSDAGKVWIVPSGATGVWSGKTNQLAYCVAAGIWRYFTPLEGWHAAVLDEDVDYRFDGTAWGEAFRDAMIFKGVIDCSTNPDYPAADRGWTYRVSVAGKIGGASGVDVEVGDILTCLTDDTPAGDQATVGDEWTIIQANLDGALTTADIGVTVAPEGDGAAAVAARNTVTAIASTAGAVEAIDLALGDYFTLALSENVTSWTGFTNLPGAGKGFTVMVRITQDATPRTVAWPASFLWADGTAGEVSTGVGEVDVLALTTFDNGTSWHATLAKAFA